MAGKRGRKTWPEGVVGKLAYFKSREELPFVEIFLDLKRTRTGTCGSWGYRSQSNNYRQLLFLLGRSAQRGLYLVKGQDQGDLGALDRSRCGRFHA